jgi:hypothetical protein
VFFSTLNEKLVSETKTYDYSLVNGGTLWSSLGGVLSLFLGVSFALLFEVFEIFVDLFFNTINFIMGRHLGRSNIM